MVAASLSRCLRWCTDRLGLTEDKAEVAFREKLQDTAHWEAFVRQYGQGPIPPTAMLQAERCMKCPLGAKECHEQHTTYVAWRTESTVTHVTEKGSQWHYKAREGVLQVNCTITGRPVELLVHSASVTCDVLRDFRGISELNFMTRGRVSVLEGDPPRMFVMQRPMFEMRGLFKSWQEFIDAIEAEMDNEAELAEFVIEDQINDERVTR